ncbi:MAG TPA: ABC transporter permease [Thermoanaerobaculia bacterium]|nr:ABC transporter permease [Thermoanaerobaculia bacterium]
MDSLWKDVRFGLRTLLKSPGTTLAALLALALGIGANTAIFSVVNGVLLKPLPYPDSGELALVWEKNPELGFPRFTVAPPNFVDWSRQSRSFEHMAAIETTRFNLTGGEQPQAVQGARVSASFFRLLGVEPARGRGFRPEEDRPGAERVAVISHGLWQSRFGSDPAVAGRPIQLDGQGYTVVGIAPEGFQFPSERQIWVPNTADLASEGRGGHYLLVVARLKDGVSAEAAETEMSGIASQLEKAYPDSNTGWGIDVIPLRENMVEDVRPALVILLVFVSFVLLIACANVANLLLARVAAREREIALRTALGAGRTRLIRQMLTETLVLFLAGGALGLLLAWWGTKALIALDPEGLPRTQEIGLDGGVLLFTLLVSLATGLLFGLVPALSAAGRQLAESLKEGGRALAGGVRGRAVRNLLVAGQVALTLVLLVGAGLLIRSFARLQAVDPGFKSEGVLTVSYSLPQASYAEPARQIAFTQQILERVKALPGVQSASTIFPLPLSGNGMVLAIAVEGRPEPPRNEVPSANVRAVTPEYFKTMGIPLLQGRSFTEREDDRAPRVAVINRAMANKIWPGESPLGKRFTFDDPGDADVKWMTVVGVVGEVRHSAMNEEAGSEAYWSQLQDPMPDAALVVRTAKDPATLAGPVREQVKALDPNLPIDQIRTLEDLVSASLSQSRFKTVLLALFAGLALVLAAVGVYGVVSYTVAQRTHEIGIRMALGAQRRSVLRLVVGQGMVLVLAGVGAGLAGAWFASRYLEGQVYGVSAKDPVTFLAVPLVLAAVALVANYLPARRATQVDPLVALRRE